MFVKRTFFGSGYRKAEQRLDRTCRQIRLLRGREAMSTKKCKIFHASGRFWPWNALLPRSQALLGNAPSGRILKTLPGERSRASPKRVPKQSMATNERRAEPRHGAGRIRDTALRFGTADVVPFQFAVQGGAFDSQNLSGLRFVPARAFQGRQDVLLFEGGQRHVPPRSRWRRSVAGVEHRKPRTGGAWGRTRPPSGRCPTACGALCGLCWASWGVEPPGSR